MIPRCRHFLSKGHWHFTEIISRLSRPTALSNRLIWHYLRIKIFVSTPLPSTQKTQKWENDSLRLRYYSEALCHASWPLCMRGRCSLTSLTNCNKNNNIICLICNLIHGRMFTSKVWTLLRESNLTARQPRSLLRRAPRHAIRATTSEGLAQGCYVASRVGFEPATLRM